MISERQEELAALHALGLLEDEERQAYDREIRQHPALEGFTAAMAESTAHLALTAPPLTPPPGLRAKVLDACQPQGESPAPTRLATITPFPMARVVPWAAAAILAVTTTWFALQTFSLRAANDSLVTQQRLVELERDTTRAQLAERSLLAERLINDLGTRLRRSEDLARLKVSALASLAGNTAEARAIAVWDPDQQAGLLSLEKLPAIAPEQDYQIWVIDPAYQNPVNGGVFHVASDGQLALAFKPDQPVTQATAFAISLEKKGGVPKAEGPIVLLGKLPGI